MCFTMKGFNGNSPHPLIRYSVLTSDSFKTPWPRAKAQSAKKSRRFWERESEIPLSPVNRLGVEESRRNWHGLKWPRMNVVGFVLSLSPPFSSILFLPPFSLHESFTGSSLPLPPAFSCWVEEGTKANDVGRLWFYVINMPQCTNEIDIDKDIPSSRRNAIWINMTGSSTW